MKCENENYEVPFNMSCSGMLVSSTEENRLCFYLCLFVCLFICLSVCLSVRLLKSYGRILMNFFEGWGVAKGKIS